jgi:hypothetical protein
MSKATDLVKIESHPVTLYKEDPFVLVDKEVVYTSKEEVQKYLPKICGRVLAKAWIDKSFYAALQQDTIGTFARYGVRMPSNYDIKFDETGNNRASIIIYEQIKNSKFKIRVCSLQLTMTAKL